MSGQLTFHVFLYIGKLPSCREKVFTIEDRRIRRTKKALKDSFVELLQTKSFKKITVTELCEAADITRVTFYTYYKDKYELVSEYFADLLVQTNGTFVRLQEQNNPGNDVVESYCNLLDSLLDTYGSNVDFFKRTASKDNPYLASMNYWFIIHNVEHFTMKRSSNFTPRYSLRATTGFLCNGIWGFINNEIAEHHPLEQIRSEARELLRGILTSGLLIADGQASTKGHPTAS